MEDTVEPLASPEVRGVQRAKLIGVDGADAAAAHALRAAGEDWPQEIYNWLRTLPLHEAARKGDVPEAKKLLEAGADLIAHVATTSAVVRLRPFGATARQPSPAESSLCRLTALDDFRN